MGIGMFAGILDPLTWILEQVIKLAMEWIIKPVFKILLVPLIQLIIETVKVLITFIFYNVGSFILALIDFIEGLFRVLCGLPSDKMSLTLGNNGGTGDILVQVIRSSEIQQAFLAMCIVGLFLLLITSVFQIIKVEYTTEGAKNSKTPILQKAFRSLANLMLLPLLVVFGIIIANGVLGVLDKATTPDEGDNPTISGLLFATAASEAHRPKDNDYFKMESTVIIDAVPGILEYVIESALETIGMILDGGAYGDTSVKEKEYYNNETKRLDIESMYINQDEDHKYWNPNHVSSDFEIMEINYLILVLGGVVVLKAFFFTVFGLVMRLYKCATLFIVAPVVIGLTPMTEGGLGKWRQSFMGEVLGAYGTVLSVNIFMIVIRVLININLNLASENFLFTSSFLTFLLKSIIVIAGCLMIEKFSKELGGYFGAADAMGAGGGMAKQVGSTALKAGMAVAGAAVGGAALVGGVAKLGAGAVKGTAGIAGKLVKGGVTAGKAGVGAVKTGAGKLAHLTGRDGKIAAKKAGKAAQKEAFAMVKAEGGTKEEAKERGKLAYDMASASTLHEYQAQKSGEKQAKKDERANKKKISEARKEIAKNEKQRSKYEKTLSGWSKNGGEDFVEAASKSHELFEKNEDLRKITADDDARIAAEKAAKDEKKAARSAKLKSFGADVVHKASNAAGAVSGAAMNAQSMFVGFGAKALDIIPGMNILKGLKKDQEAGAAMLGSDHEAALKAAQDKSKDRKQKILAGALLGTNTMQNVSRSAAVLETTQQVVKDAKIEQVNLEAGALRTLNSAIANSSMFNSMSKQDQAQYALSMADKLGDMGANISAEQVMSLISAGVQQQKYDFQFNFDASAIEKAVNEALRKGGSVKDIEQSLKALLDKQADAGNKLMIKKIEELLKKFQSELGGK